MEHKIRLDDLARTELRLTRAHTAFLEENCIACMDHAGHRSGVLLGVEFIELATTVQVEWTRSIDTLVRLNYLDERRRTEYGAIAIALLLIPTFTDYAGVLPSATGNGIDYHLE